MTVRAGPARWRLVTSTLLPVLAPLLFASACAARVDRNQMRPGQPCPAGPVDNYLETRWQLCWFEEPNGRWRRIDHTLHYGVLVVQAEATSLDLADTIARRFVERHAERFPEEILIYVRAAQADRPTRVRRVTWTEGGGYQSLEYDR